MSGATAVFGQVHLSPAIDSGLPLHEVATVYAGMEAHRVLLAAGWVPMPKPYPRERMACAEHGINAAGPNWGCPDCLTWLRREEGRLRQVIVEARDAASKMALAGSDEAHRLAVRLAGELVFLYPGGPGRREEDGWFPASWMRSTRLVVEPRDLSLAGAIAAHWGAEAPPESFGIDRREKAGSVVAWAERTGVNVSLPIREQDEVAPGFLSYVADVLKAGIGARVGEPPPLQGPRGII